jgi:2,3-diketo-5-methylthio-1-phosphopentane phosphatase
MRIKIFCDFDGTITKVDVGDLLFRKFVGDSYLRLVAMWRDEMITAIEMWEKACDMLNIDMERVENLILEQEIDRCFIDFVRFCEERGIEIFVISDGFDFYIEKIFKRYGLNVRFFSNRLKFSDGKFKPEFPHPDSICRRCANCKRNHMLSLSGDDDIVIYIGDGFSDRCPAEYADIVFGKGELLRYCRENNIPVYRFENFADIIEQMERFLSGRKKIRRRWQAELKRREIFIRE